jgi:hypothetical protein
MCDMRRDNCFPLIEQLVGSDLEHALGGAATAGSGPVWGEASEELNATLLAWRAGSGPPESINRERDVLVFVIEGSVVVSVEAATGCCAPARP